MNEAIHFLDKYNSEIFQKVCSVDRMGIPIKVTMQMVVIIQPFLIGFYKQKVLKDKKRKQWKNTQIYKVFFIYYFD